MLFTFNRFDKNGYTRFYKSSSFELRLVKAEISVFMKALLTNKFGKNRHLGFYES